MDIVDRLRELYVQNGTNHVEEAAREIERLRAENEDLQRALTAGIHTCGATCRETPLCAEMSDLRAERDALKAAFEEYSSHYNWCAGIDGLECSCGYRKAVAALRGEGE